MSVSIWAVTFFVIAFLLHLVIWRLRYPKNPVKALIFLFSAIILTGLIFMFNFAPAGFLYYLYIVLIFFSLFFCYLITYSAIEADSPSLVIVMSIFQSGREGLAYEKIKESLGNNLLVDPRLKDLVDAKLVDLAGSIYKINKKGLLFILPIVVYRNLLGLGKGG